jgi:hypothetical protein
LEFSVIKALLLGFYIPFILHSRFSLGSFQPICGPFSAMMHLSLSLKQGIGLEEAGETQKLGLLAQEVLSPPATVFSFIT